MKITTTEKNNITIVSISGPIKSGMEFDFWDVLEQLHDKNVIVNFTDCPWINSAALGIILNTWKEIEKRNGRFVLCCIGSDMNNLLKTTKLKDIFEIHKTLESAIEGFE